MTRFKEYVASSTTKNNGADSKRHIRCWRELKCRFLCTFCLNLSQFAMFLRVGLKDCSQCWFDVISSRPNCFCFLLPKQKTSTTDENRFYAFVGSLSFKDLEFPTLKLVSASVSYLLADSWNVVVQHNLYLFTYFNKSQLISLFWEQVLCLQSSQSQDFVLRPIEKILSSISRTLVALS